MIPMPDWAYEILKKTTCPYCHAQFEPEDVTAVGIRSVDSGQSCFFFELDCKRCHHPAMTLVKTRPMGVGELAAELDKLVGNPNRDPLSSKDSSNDPPRLADDEADAPDDSNAPPTPKKAKKTPKEPGGKSKITDSEVNKFKKAMAKAKTNEDLLFLMGMTKEEIEKFTKEDQDEGQ